MIANPGSANAGRAVVPVTQAEPDVQGTVNSAEPAIIALGNAMRYEYCRNRGHQEFCRTARRNEDFYLGGGKQWADEVRAELETQGRPATEINEIMGAVNTAIGYQIANRMDVTCVARGNGANDDTAQALNLIFKSELDRLKFRWQETQVFGDGLIQQRGYFEMRISANENMQGELCLSTLDPMDVLPDPDAKSYEPDDWADVIITRWQTADELEMFHGKQVRDQVESFVPVPEQDWGNASADDGVPRAKFGDVEHTSAYDHELQDGSVKRYRIIDRQHHVYETGMVAIYPDTGDIVPLEAVSNEELESLKEQGVLLTQRRHKRVRWTVSCLNVLLKDAWSPYKHFTVIPYFPYFRRGRTRGMVDNAISPQEVLNKATAQALHIANSTANSGWLIEQESLVSPPEDEMEDKGASTGLNIIYKKGSTPPKKIEVNQIPVAMVQIANDARNNIKATTGVNESMTGAGQPDMSGVAIQSRQFAAQQQLAMPLDNLDRTRNMVGTRALELFQAYYTDEREFKLTEMNAFGEPSEKSMTINQAAPGGVFLRDMTIGNYGVVITAQPMAITFDNSQFEQITTMRKDMHVAIPDAVVVKTSNLANKGEILQAMKDQAPQPDPLTQAKTGTEQAKAASLAATADLTKANTELLRTQAVNTSVTGMYSATRAGAELAAMPSVAPLADQLLKAAGFVDKDSGPIVPNVPPSAQIAAPPPSESTHPLTPPHPDVGVDAGIQQPTGVPAP